jgi:hypothetical protein
MNYLGFPYDSFMSASLTSEMSFFCVATRSIEICQATTGRESYAIV